MSELDQLREHAVLDARERDRTRSEIESLRSDRALQADKIREMADERDDLLKQLVQAQSDYAELENEAQRDYQALEAKLGKVNAVIGWGQNKTPA